MLGFWNGQTSIWSAPLTGCMVTSESRKSLAVPRNSSAMDVLNEQFGKHWQWVFPLKGKVISVCNN